MNHGTLVEMPLDLLAAWWTPLEQAGLTVEVGPEIEATAPGIVYRPGVVKSSNAEVSVMPHSGPAPPHASPLAGKQLLLVQNDERLFVRRDRLPDRQLVETVVAILVGCGGRRVEPAGQHQARR